MTRPRDRSQPATTRPAPRRRCRCLLLCATLVAAPLLAGPASRAQSIDTFLPATASSFTDPSSVPVLSRPRPDYDTGGVRLGEFVIRPQLAEAVGFDDNPVGLRNRRGSAVVTTTPTIEAASDFSRNAVGLSLGLADSHYLQQPGQNRTDYTATATTTLDVGRDKLTLLGSYLALHEDPTQINSAALASPLAYVAKQLQASYLTEVGRVRLEPNLAYLSYRFDGVTEPGDTLSQKARDRDLYAAGLTVRFGLDTARSLIATFRASDTNYVGPLAGQARPNSFAYEGLVGTDYALSGNLRVLLLAGFELRQFSSSAYRQQSAPVVQAAVVWTPTGLTTVTARASRSIQDSVGEAITGVTFTRALVRVDHELRRNVLLAANAGVELAEYSAGGSDEVIYRAGASVSYLFTRKLRGTVSYQFENRSGAQSGLAGSLTGTPVNGRVGDYSRNIVLLGLTASL